MQNFLIESLKKASSSTQKVELYLCGVEKDATQPDASGNSREFIRLLLSDTKTVGEWQNMVVKTIFDSGRTSRVYASAKKLLGQEDRVIFESPLPFGKGEKFQVFCPYEGQINDRKFRSYLVRGLASETLGESTLSIVLSRVGRADSDCPMLRAALKECDSEFQSDKQAETEKVTAPEGADD